MATHKPEACMNMLTEMKGKGDMYLSKFTFGCMSGDHTCYAFVDAASEDDVKKMLPKDGQENVKIQQVSNFTVAQIEKIHKEHSGM